MQLAADVLADVHREPAGATGSSRSRSQPEPRATTASGTIESARTYWKARRPALNVMIKIPGTPEGVPAIEQAIYEGININITLLFAVDRRTRRSRRRISAGLERRHAGGQVARHQFGRELLRLARRHEGRPQARGARATRSSRARPRSRTRGCVPPVQGDLRRARGGRSSEQRRRRGAAAAVGVDRHQEPQLPGHASTSTSLVGPHTVNTMPLNDDARVRRPRRSDRGDGRGSTPPRTWRRWRDAGIDMTQVTEELLEEGVDQFVDALDRLLEGIEERRAAVLTGQAEHDPGADSRRPRRPGRRAGQAGGRRQRRAAGVAPRPVAVGRPRCPRDRGPARVADRVRDDARARAGARRVRREVPRRRVHRRRAARYGRLVARARGAPPLVRRGPGRAQADRCSTRPTPTW